LDEMMSGFSVWALANAAKKTKNKKPAFARQFEQKSRFFNAFILLTITRKQ